jgi:hypothetical protein
MNKYCRIDVPNLELLQEQLLTLIPQELYKSPRLYFLPDQSKFFKIAELVALLDMYSLKHDSTNFALYVMGPNFVGPIHIDWGKTEYSMNIPICNCDNTFTSFYKADREPLEIPARTINRVKYNPHYSFEGIGLELVDQLESNVPYIMHIKTPHNVVNNNSKFRVNLLIRNWDNDLMSNILKGGSPAISRY